MTNKTKPDLPPETCSHIVFPGSWHIDPEPPEYCDEPVVDGFTVCEMHLEDEI